MMDNFRQAFLRETRHVFELIAGDMHRFVRRRGRARHRAGSPAPVAPPLVPGWSSDPLDWLADALATLRADMAETARRAGRRVDVEIDAEPIRVDPRLLEALAATLGAVARSRVLAIDTPRRRRAAGRPAAGRIQIAARVEGGELTIELTDDGALPGRNPEERGIANAPPGVRTLAEATASGMCHRIVAPLAVAASRDLDLNRQGLAAPAATWR